ncbi:hypothetical protein K8R30_00695 [archaeon]|nr:hypothetical protein [archaeon]
MADDLLARLFDVLVSLGKAPDELSIEYGRRSEDNRPVIRFGWSDTNKEKIYGYTDERYDEVQERSNGYWHSVDAS